MLDVYERCVVLMKQELPYIPQVDTFDDVLRIREKKELVRFKEVMKEWITYMAENEAKLANKMQDDILKANKELKKYCKMKNNISTFFFYFPIFSSFIPIIPSVAWWGIEQGIKAGFDYKINKYNWIGIGNP